MDVQRAARRIAGLPGARLAVGVTSGLASAGPLGGAGSVDLLGRLGVVTARDEIEDASKLYGIGVRVGILGETQLTPALSVALERAWTEEIVYGEIATGATSDLNKVNNIARRMVKEFGMSRLGRIYCRDQSESAFLMGSGFGEGERYSEQTAREIDMAVRSIVKAAHDKAVAILSREKALLESWAKRLLEKETLAEAELSELRRSLSPAS